MKMQACTWHPILASNTILQTFLEKCLILGLGQEIHTMILERFFFFFFVPDDKKVLQKTQNKTH